jgi:hypothetical protein
MLRQNLIALTGGVLLAAFGTVAASEYHPQRPFAGMVRLPEKGQWIVTPWFSYSAFQSYWAGVNEVDVSQGDNEYDVEYYSGQVVLEYSPWHKWAFDLTVGYVDEATRCFNPDGNVETTHGIMDTQVGIRYSVSTESAAQRWVPDFTLRVGGIFPGSYDDKFPFAPGYGEVGIEPGILARKTLWGYGGRFAGGLYGTAAYRHMVSYAPDSVVLSAGFFQQLAQFTLAAGYRQQQALSGPDVGPPDDLNYYNRVREINYQAVWGGSYTFKNGIALHFFMDSNFDGRNTGEKLTYHGAASFPF